MTRIRVSLLTMAAVVALAGCAVPPLHRSVVVETNSQGVPVHASGRMAGDRYTVVRGDTLYSIAFRANVDYHQLARWNGIRAPYVIQPGRVLRVTRPDDMPTQQPQAPVFQSVSSASPSSRSTKPSQAPTPVFKPVPPGTTSAAASGSSGATTQATSVPAAPVSTVVAVAGKPPVVATAPDASERPAIPDGATRDVAGIDWRWPASGNVLNQFNPSDAMPGISIAGNAGDPVRAAADGVVVYSGNGLVGYGELVIIKHSDDYLSAYGHNSKRLVKEGEHVQAGQVIARIGSTGAPRNELEFQVRYKGEPVDPMDYLPKR